MSTEQAKGFLTLHIQQQNPKVCQRHQQQVPLGEHSLHPDFDLLVQVPCMHLVDAEVLGRAHEDVIAIANEVHETFVLLH